MLTYILDLILLYYISKYIVNKIKKIKIGDKNENDENFWMFTYDFKPEKKDSIFDRESTNKLNKKKTKNDLIGLLYITHIAIFIYANYFLSQILKLILK